MLKIALKSRCNSQHCMPEFETIDFHFHTLPKEAYMGTQDLRGVYTVASVQDPVNDAIRNMRESNTDVEVISFPREMSREAELKLTRAVNDEYAGIVKRNPGKFAALATLPMSDIKRSMEELDHAVNDLELQGVVIKAHANEAPLDDERFWPLYQKLNALGITVFVHPGRPPWGDASMEKYNLAVLLGYQFDTVLAATRMIYSGLFDEFPKIKFVFAHLGAGLPYIVHRISAPFVRSKERPQYDIRAKKRPIDYLKMSYFDTAAGDVDTMGIGLRCLLDAVGADHVVFGTDYPWQNSKTIHGMRQSIIDMKISDNDKKKILGENSRKLLHLD